MSEAFEYEDLRGWLEIVRGRGEIVDIEGAHWDGEMGALTYLARRRRQGPALLFDHIPGHAPGQRILVNTLGSCRRLGLALGLGTVTSDRELLEKWKEKWKALKLVPAESTRNAPFMENRRSGSEIDLGSLPAPRWHEGDSGRYLGTGCVVILRDPDTGWVNLGTYRVQLHGANRITCFIGATHHGYLIRQKYLNRGEPCPVAITLGQDPLLLVVASALGVPPNKDEYEYAGGIKGRPIPVVAGELTGLPIPASAEVALEGYFLPEEKVQEGPFGEFTGYYASGARLEPVIEIKQLYHRTDPILTGASPSRPPNEGSYVNGFLRSGSVEEEMKGAGVPDLRAVWCHEVGAGRMLIVVAIHQRYPGHAKQALAMATSCYTGVQNGKMVIVVDEDVDVSNLDEVMWAACTRVDPERDVEIIRRMPGSFLDPSLERDHAYYQSRLLIDATRPFEWRERFARTVTVDKSVLERVQERWGRLLDQR